MKHIQDDEKTLVEEADTGTHNPQPQTSQYPSQPKAPHHQDPLINAPDIFQQQDEREELILQLTYEIQQLRLDYIIGIRQFSLDYDYLSAGKRRGMIQDLNVKQALVVAKDLQLFQEKENLPLRVKLAATPLEVSTWNLTPYPDPPAPRPLRREPEIGNLGTSHHLDSHLHPLAQGDLYWTRRFFRKGKGEPEELRPDYGEGWARGVTALVKVVRACGSAQEHLSGETEVAETDDMCWDMVSLDDRRVIILLILQAGVEKDERDVHGMTALEYARVAGDEFLIAVLESPELPLFARFLLAISEGEIDVVKDLLEINPEVYSLLLGRGVSGLRVAGRRANEKAAAYVAYLEHSNRAAAGEEAVTAEVLVYYGIIKILLRCEGAEAECDVVDKILRQVEQGVFAERNVELIELLRSSRKVSLE